MEVIDESLPGLGDKALDDVIYAAENLLRSTPNPKKGAAKGV